MIFNAKQFAEQFWTVPEGFPMPCKCVDIDTGEVVPLVVSYDSDSWSVVRKKVNGSSEVVIERRRLRFEGEGVDIHVGRVRMVFNPFGRTHSEPIHDAANELLLANRKARENEIRAAIQQQRKVRFR